MAKHRQPAPPGLAKLPVEDVTITAQPEGRLAGHTFVMRELSARLYFALRRGELDDADLLKATVEAVVDSTVEDLLALSPNALWDLVDGWVKAHRRRAVPEASGEQ